MFMLCPSCSGVQLVMSERQGIEIDYCPECRGVWLDRGELDKIIEKSAALERPGSQQYSAQDHQGGGYGGKGGGYGQQGHDHRYRKKSFWHELFD